MDIDYRPGVPYVDAVTYHYAARHAGLYRVCMEGDCIRHRYEEIVNDNKREGQKNEATNRESKTAASV